MKEWVEIAISILGSERVGSWLKNKLEEDFEDLVNQSLEEIPGGEEVTQEISASFIEEVSSTTDVRDISSHLYNQSDKLEFQKSSREEAIGFIEELGIDSSYEGIDENVIEMVREVYPMLKTLDKIPKIEETDLKSELEETKIKGCESKYRRNIFLIFESLSSKGEDILNLFSYIFDREIEDIEDIKIDKDSFKTLSGKIDISIALIKFMDLSEKEQKIKDLERELRDKYKTQGETVVSGLKSVREFFFIANYMFILVLLARNRKFVEDKETRILKNMESKLEGS